MPTRPVSRDTIIPDRFSMRARFPLTLEAPALNLLAYVAEAYGLPTDHQSLVGTDGVNRLLVRLATVEARRLAEAREHEDAFAILLRSGPMSAKTLACLLSERAFAPWSDEREDVSTGIAVKRLRRLEAQGLVVREPRRPGDRSTTWRAVPMYKPARERLGPAGYVRATDLPKAYR